MTAERDRIDRRVAERDASIWGDYERLNFRCINLATRWKAAEARATELQAKFDRALLTIETQALMIARFRSELARHRRRVELGIHDTSTKGEFR